MDSTADPLPPVAEPAARQCGECTVCCTVLAVDELKKPMRWACEHLACGGCRIYDERPTGCREFDCLWLRGAIGDDEGARPDRLGIVFDSFFSAATGAWRFVAFEAWTGAFADPAAARLIEAIASQHPIELSHRNGAWETLEAPGGRE